eukprot:Seg2912.2 transcript_id=Seg2912.2/GoldUCD/mRNA.D3Y31 product="BTB/POZ domain-containing protein 2" protein_id=Seg2912.2/GoldUCD/D3Y31
MTTPGKREENGWQDSIATLKERMSHLLRNPFMSDFTFVCDDAQIPVHKFVLASSSSVFYSMFFGPLAEKKPEIDLSDFGDSECILQFLQFLYTYEVSLNWNNVFQILNLAKCYMITSLQEKCTEFIQESVTDDSSLHALQQCIIYDEKIAVKKCLKRISENATQMIKKDKFLDLGLESLKEILKMDTLKVKEVDLFLAVDKWCEQKLTKARKQISAQSKQEMLGDAIYLIRFPTMSWQDFGKHCSMSGLLTSEQVVHIVHYLSLQCKDLQETFLERIPFSSKPRYMQREILASRMGPTCKLRDWVYLGNPDALAFSINKQAALKGFSLFGDPTRNKITDITIKTHSSTITPTFTLANPNSGKVPGTFRVTFKQPVEILPSQQVDLSVTISGPKSSAIDYNAVNKFELENFVCQFMSSSFFPNANCTSVSHGQFPELSFHV